MLGEINFNKKPQKPEIFLAKPNRQIIGKLSEAYNIKYNHKIIELNDLEFEIPYDIEVNHEKVRNRNIDLLKERYLLKVVLGNQTEWCIITRISDSMDDEKDTKNIQAYSLGYQLKDKSIRGYQVDSYNMRQVLTDVLAETPWGIGVIDADFELTYRAFDFSSTSVLDAVYKIGETYNAVIQWDTVNRLIGFVKPELHGIQRGLKVSYGHYLRTLGKDSNADEMVTRLKPFGQDGLSINSVNPIGQNFIQNFSYFMFPFDRDTERNIIQQSYYMTDPLCHALLDYEALVESKKNDFNTLLTNKENLQVSLIQKDTEMNTLKNQEALVTDNMLVQQFDENMWFNKFIYNGVPITISQPTKRPEYSYVVLCKVSQTTNIAITLNSVQKTVQSGTWVVLGKVKDLNLINIGVSGSATNTEVFTQIANITIDEYNTIGNENALIEKYSLDNKQMQIAQKQAEIDSVNTEIATLNTDIDNLRITIAMENNFTQAQMDELSDYIISRDFVDENYVDAHDLYNDAMKKFEELRKPQMIIKIDIVNFKEIVEEQGNWDKLVLGDYITIEYEKMKTKVTAKIIEISYDYEEANVSLTIANIKDVSDDERKLEKYIYNSIGTTTTVSMEKNKWGKAVTDSSEISQLFENIWNKITNDINMASNEYVVYDRKGLTIYDPNDPLRFLRATHGALALTRSGGLRYETAITADGIIAERLFGKIILTQRVVIGDDDGIWLTEGAKTTITDRCGREVMKIGLYEENPDKFGMIVNRYDPSVACTPTVMNKVIVNNDDGFKIQRKKISVFDDVFYTSLDGDLFMKGNFQAGEGEQIFKVTHTGLQLGGSVWDTAPLHADMFGNVWMNKLFADDAEIANSWFRDGHIIGSDLTLGVGNQVIKLFPNIGLWAGNDLFALAPFSVDMGGNLKAHKAKFYGQAGQILIDTDIGTIYMNNFDIEGVGRLTAELINTSTIVAGDGYISNLVVKSLRTIGGTDYTLGQAINYIDVRGNEARWITGTVTTIVQAKDSKSRNLFWLDATKKFLTIENTGIPAYQYSFSEVDRLKIYFEGTGVGSYPVSVWGVGDGVIVNTPNFKDSGKGYLIKDSDSFFWRYNAKINGNLREVRMDDTGTTISSQSGVLKLNHSTGSYIEITTTGDINIHSVGNINLTGSRININ